MPGDSSCVLVNETAARLLGYSADAVNKAVYFHDSNPEGGFKILGVVKDFNASSLRDKIEPIVFHLGEDNGEISFRVDTKNISSLISLIKEQYKSMDIMGDDPFIYSFLNDDFNNLYKSDERTGKIYVSFTLFAILIACFGLFGLVAYASEQRIKEIGIQKVLGASTGNVIRLLSKDFLKLIIIAIVIACPLAFWGSYKWLEDFAYRTKIGVWIFVLAGFLTMVITMATIFFQSIKVARVNPAEILRNE
jgi:putative ABC transport system permease protein